MRLSKFSLFVGTSLMLVLSSCKKDIHIIKEVIEDQNKGNTKKIYVYNVNQLYDAINNPANEATTLILAPGTYMLDSIHPNGGRLELLRNMSLMGQQGDAGSVVIDVSALPRSSVTIETSLGPLRTGVVRTGNGSNSIEWMTLQNDGKNENIRSIIQTDIAATQTASVRIAHTIVQGADIGINIANRDTTSNGRTIDAIVEDNEIRNNTLPPYGEGILIQSQSANDGTINVIMRRNYIHANLHGIFGVNYSCRNHQINIESYNDRMEDNGLGIGFWGGHSDDNAGPAENNSIRFSAFSTDIRNNTNTSQALLVPIPGGVFAAAGELEEEATQGVVNNNRVEAHFTDCRIEGNTGTAQINAFGAYSFVAGTPAGSHNVCAIYLKGISQYTAVNAVSSFPVEPAGTNKAIVYQ